MVGRFWVDLETFEHLAGSQPTWDRVYVADSAWGEHGTGLLYRWDSAWTDRVRGDGVGIRNVDAMSHEPQQQGNSEAGNDGRGTIGQRESRVVGGRGGREHDATAQQGRDRIIISDGARVGLGYCIVHDSGSRRPYRVRGDGLAIRHIFEVLGWSGIRGDASSGDDGGAAWRQFEWSVVCGRRRTECVTELESRRDGVGVNDGAWCVLWVDPAHKHPSGRSHEMRGDGMGVGHVGEVSNRARSPRDAAGGDDGGEYDGEPKSGMVHGQCISQIRSKWKQHGSSARAGSNFK